ncbi:MAG: glycoside hydrolase family 13 protein [Candidatus Microbacterium stercoravium]
MTNEWWRSAVIYQVYPRSFADASGDGVGDLAGIASRLEHVRSLGADVVWLSPFMTSPQKDAGYDVSDYRDVDPLFGTLGDFDALVARAHELGLRVIVDLVPNHSSDQHPWFQEALAADPGSAARDRYIFREGHGDRPPNNWQSVFGGPAWTRVADGQWYLHLFDASQPDFDWSNDEVRQDFRDTLRFWLDRGADGFRVDVAHGLVKADGLPDYTPPENADSMGGAEPVPYWGQDGVHDVYRDWHAVLAEYEGDRVLCAEAWMPTVEEIAKWVRPDEMHQAFNFAYLTSDWNAAELRGIIDDSLAAFGRVGAPSTWVLSNHDVIRHATRLALGDESPQGHGIGPGSKGIPDTAFALRRGRAATALMLALPGSAYLYQGEELGLPEAVDIPDDARQDPTWFRTGGERYGRDGCRVPLPWEADAPAYGFSATGRTWLPQPESWGSYARDAQAGVAGSTLELYRTLLRLRRERALGTGSLEWLDSPAGTLAFRNGDVTVMANLADAPVPLPEGEILAASAEVTGRELPADTAVWLAARA